MTRTRTLSAVLLAVVALVLLSAPAGAHTEADASAAPDGRTAVSLSFEHGCDGAPTTTFRVQVPAGASDVQPQDPEGWSSTVEDDQVVWTGGSIDGAGTFTLELVLAEPAGATVTVPAIQECPGGAEEAWIERPDGGAPLDHPAPTFVVPVNDSTPTTAAAAPGPSTTETTVATSDTTARMAIEATPVTVEGSDTSTTGLVVFVVIVVVIVGGGAVLYLRHRHTGRV